MDSRTAEVLATMAGDQADREAAMLKLGFLLGSQAMPSPEMRVTMEEAEALTADYKIVMQREPDGTFLFRREARVA